MSRPRLQFLLAFATLAVLLATTYLFWLRTHQLAESQLTSEFDYRVKRTTARMDFRTNAFRDILAGAQGFYSSMQPTQRQFYTYVDKLELPNRSREVESLGVTLAIPRGADKKKMRALNVDRLSGLQISLDGILSSPLNYQVAEPDRSGKLVSFDVDPDSVKAKLAAMWQAAETGEATFTSRVTLHPNGTNQNLSGFYMYLPIYRLESTGKQHDTSSKEVVGWVHLAFRADELFKKFLQPSFSDFRVQVYDGLHPSSSRLLYDSKPDALQAQPASVKSRYSAIERLTVAGRTWTIVCDSYPSFEARRNEIPSNLIATVGSGMSFLITFILWSLLGARRRALDLVEAKTTELHEEQDRLRQVMNAVQASAIVSITDKNSKILSVNEKFCEVSGYSKEELVGKEHRIVNSGLEPKSLFKDLWQTILAGKTWSGEVRNRKKSGEVYTVAAVITPIRRSDGSIEQFLAVSFDLTTQRVYQQRLLEAQEIAKIGSWHYDFETQTLSFSTEFYRITELDESIAASSLRRTYRQLIHPEDVAEFDRLALAALSQGEDMNFLHRLVLDGGARIKHVRAIGRVTKDRSGRPIFINGTCQDITEHVTRELEHRMILDAMGIGTWTLDPRTMSMQWDESKFKLFETERIPGEDHYEAWAKSLEDSERKKVLRALESAMAENTDFRANYEIFTKLGKKKHISTKGSIVRNHLGEPIKVFGVSWDRTREHEAEYEANRQRTMTQAVLDNIPNMVFVKDFKNERRFTLLNKAGESILGVRADDFKGKTDHEIFPKDIADSFTIDDRAAFASGKLVTIIYEDVETPTGRRQLRTYKVPTYDEAGQPNLLIGISMDITEELQTQRQLEVERAKSMHNSKLASLGEMSAGIAHEINNPLAIIEGVLRHLKKHKDDPAKFDAKLESILKSTGRISRIVNGLKKFARASHGVEHQPTKLAQIIEEVLILTEAKAKRHMTAVSTAIETSASIVCDSVEIEQVFINLVNNGIDAVRQLDEKWLKIHAFEDADHIVVRVMDSGHGIPNETEQKLFQPFFTTKPVGEGTGLGLSISKGILDQHRASISINRTFKNTCFEVRFAKVKEAKNAA